MNPTKIYQINKPQISSHYEKNNSMCNRYTCQINTKLYQFDFPKTKRTIKTPNGYILENIPAFSMLLPVKYINPLTCILMGHIKDNKLVGMKINGCCPWICGDAFNKVYNSPEDDIINVINDLWQTDFPYYKYDHNQSVFINLQQFTKLT